jgi:regulator of nucleoside diphosphate kinase
MIDILIVAERDFETLRPLAWHPDLERELNRAIVVSDEAVPPDVVTMGARVIYTDEATGERQAVRLVYPWKASEPDTLSILNPTGTALLGLSVGQRIEWEFADGTRRWLRVDGVDHRSA